MYAIIQFGCTVFGIGATPEQALDDAREWMDQAGEMPPRYRFGQITDGDMALIECSEAFADYVSKHGAPDRWDIVDDVAVLENEIPE